MVTIYTCPSHVPSKKTKEWLKGNGLEYTERKVTAGNSLNEDELMKMLRMVEDLYDLISTQSKTYKKHSAKIERMTVKRQLIPFLQKNIEILNFPIVMNNHLISTGFREENLKKFMPKGKRIQLLHELVESIEKENSDSNLLK